MTPVAAASPAPEGDAERQQDTWFSALMAQMEKDHQKPSSSQSSALPMNFFQANASPFTSFMPEGMEGQKFNSLAGGNSVASILDLLPALQTPLPTFQATTSAPHQDPFQALRSQTGTPTPQPHLNAGVGAAHPNISPASSVTPTLGGSLSSVSSIDEVNVSPSRARSSSLNINAQPFGPKFGNSYPPPTANAAPQLQAAPVKQPEPLMSAATWPPVLNVPAAVQAVWGAAPQLLPIAGVIASGQGNNANTAAVGSNAVASESDDHEPGTIGYASDTLSYTEADFTVRWAPSVKQMIFFIQAVMTTAMPSHAMAVAQLSSTVRNTIAMQRLVIRTLPQLSTIPAAPVGVPGLVEVLAEFGWDGMQFPDTLHFLDLQEALKELEPRGNETELRSACETLMLDPSIGPERISYASRILNLYRRGVAGLDAAFISKLVYDLLEVCAKVDPHDVTSATTALNTLFLILKRASAADRTAGELRRALQPDAFCVRLREVARLHGMEQKAAWCANKLTASDRDKPAPPTSSSA